MSEPTSRFSDVSSKKQRGVTYTPPALARLLAEKVVAAAPSGRACTALDPACGDGVLLAALAEAWSAQRSHALDIVGLDVDPSAVQQAQLTLSSSPFRHSVTMGDFLSEGGAPVDIVVANPPWVRTQVLGSAQARAVAAKFGLSGRIDLAQAFVLAIADRLCAGGVAGVWVPNKLLMTRGAETFRRVLMERVSLLEVADLGDTRWFDAAVLPALLVFAKKPVDAPARFWSCYTATEADRAPVAVKGAALDDVLTAAGAIAIPDGRTFVVHHGDLSVRGAHATWQRGGAAVDGWLDTVQAHTCCTLGELGSVRVGIKSTADPVFVRPNWDQFPEDTRPELLRPLTTHHRARSWVPLPRAPHRCVLYPHGSVNGQRVALDLAAYPKSRAYLESCRAQLESRSYIRESGRQWFELWVPHDPDGWSAPKIVLRDIAPRCTAWLDTEGTVVNGDCYWLTVDEDDDRTFLALAVCASSFIDAWYDRVCNNRLYAGRRRYFAQFVAAFPLPDPQSPAGKALVTLARTLYEARRSAAANTADVYTSLDSEVDEAVWHAFGLDPSSPPP